jgi:hypothetical protein
VPSNAVPSDFTSNLAARLTLCTSELNNLQKNVLGNFAENEMRVQLQEAKIKLKAAEEEIEQLLVRNNQGDGNSGSRCRLFERESSICKTELRTMHAKVICISGNVSTPLSTLTCYLQYAVLQSLVSSFLDAKSASGDAPEDASTDNQNSQEKEDAESRLSAAFDDEHSHAVPHDQPDAPVTATPAFSVSKHPKSERPTASLNSPKPSPPQVFDADVQIESAHEDSSSS